MLDRIDAGADGAHHPLGGGGVDRDQAARVVRRGDPRVELGLRQGGPARLALAPMIIGVEFDDVGAAATWSRTARIVSSTPATSCAP